MRESRRSYSRQICGVRSFEALSQIRISKSLKVCASKLSSSSGKNSCPLNTGIPVESLGIELEPRALIPAEYVGRSGADQQAPVRYTFMTSQTAATRAGLRLFPLRAPHVNCPEVIRTHRQRRIALACQARPQGLP